MNVEDRVRTIVLAQLKLPGHAPGASVERIARDASFASDLEADSLDMVEIAMAIEDEFKIEITDDEIERLATFGDAVALVEQRTA